MHCQTFTLPFTKELKALILLLELRHTQKHFLASHKLNLKEEHSLLVSINVSNHWLTSDSQLIYGRMHHAQFQNIVNGPTARRQNFFQKLDNFIPPTLLALIFLLSSLFISPNPNAFLQSSNIKQAHRFSVKANRTLWHTDDRTPSYFLRNCDSFPQQHCKDGFIKKEPVATAQLVTDGCCYESNHWF